MKTKMKRLLAALMAAAMLLPAVGLTEETTPVAVDAVATEVALEPEVAIETVLAAQIETAAANNSDAIRQLLEKYGMELEYLVEALGKSEAELYEMDPAAVEEYIVWMLSQSAPKPTERPDGDDVTPERLAEMCGITLEQLEWVFASYGFEYGSVSAAEAEEIVAIVAEMNAAGALPGTNSTPKPTRQPAGDDVTPERLAEMCGITLEQLEWVFASYGFEYGSVSAAEAEEIVAIVMEMNAAGALPTPLPTPIPTPAATSTVEPTAAPNVKDAQSLADQYGVTVSQLAKMFEMSVSELNSMSAEAMAELEVALNVLAEEYKSVDELAKDMGISLKDLAEITGKSVDQLRAMTTIQVMALIADLSYDPTYRFQTIYDLANWYGLSVQEIGDLLGEFAPNLVYKTPAQLEEMDAKLRAMGVKPNLSIKTAQQLADKYGMTVSELADLLGLSVSDLEKLSPEAITELDAALKEAGFEAKVEFATAPDVADKHGLTLNQISILTGYTVEELTTMTPDRLKELDEKLQNRTDPVFQNVDQLAKWFSISTDDLEKRTNVSYYDMLVMTPEQLFELYEYLISIEDSGNIEGFQIENGVLVKYTGEERNVVIPESVTVIGYEAFCDSYISSVKLHSGITKIEDRAFIYCRGLSEIYIPDSVTSIGSSAFQNCSNLLTARLPVGLTSIQDQLFDGCSKLKQVNIPSGVTRIGNSAFYNTRLTSVSLPAGLKSIGWSAFSGNSKLDKVKLPEGLEIIGAWAFSGCKLTEIIVPDSVTEIGQGAFADGDLEVCVLPSNLKTLPDHLFQSNYQLKMVTLPDNLQIVGEGVFSNCSELTYVDLPKTVTRIERAAFWGCTGLEYVNIPASVTYLHEDAFSFCNHYKLVLLIPKEKKFIDYCTKYEFMYYYNDRVSYIEYDPAKVTLLAGQKYVPTMYVDFTDVDTITYSSSNSKVATVDSKGVITAKAGGTAKITAKSKKGGASATLTVTVKSAPSEVKLNKSSAEIAVGGSLTLTPSIPSGSMTEYSWSSSNSAVAAVDENGNVYAITPGESVITVKTLNGKTASCKVIVRTAPTAMYLDEAKTMGAGQTVTLKPVIEPEYAFQGVTYASSNSGVVQVAADGKLTAKAAGTAVITATTSNGISRQMTVTVLAAPTKIALNAAKITMGVGQTGQLTASVSPASAYGTVAYSSSNAKVVSVDRDGNVTALKTGSATITVQTYNGKKATCKITVQKAPSSISLSAAALTLGVGEERTLTATITKKTTAAITWTTSDENVVKVEKGTIAPVGIGTATVTATTHNGKSASCEIIVKAAPTRVQLSAESMTLSVKQKGKLGVTLFNGDSTDCAGKYTFVSSNAKIATVSASGELTAVKAGKATIKVRTYDEDVYALCEVTVVPLPTKVKLDKTSATLGAGETLQLTPSLTPANSVAGYTFSSSKASVAKVDQNGLVTAVKPGTATITVKTHNGKKATCKITVKAAPTTLMLSTESMVLGVGQTGKISASVNKDAASAFRISVSDENVVNCSGSTLVAKNVGTAVVTVETFNGLKKSCTVTVRPAPTELVIKSDALVLSVGQSSGLDVEMLADGSTDCAGALSYSVSNTKIIAVSESGKITAKSAGTATVTVRSHNSDVSAQCTVRVVAAPKSVTLNKKSAQMVVGETMQLIPSVSPASSPATFTFTSNKPSVVIAGKDGTLTAVGKGSATVTVKTHNGKTATCKITVTAPAN